MEYDNNHLRKSDLDQHQDIYLILYDIWSKLSGDNFAHYNVKIESERRPFYNEAWNWALKLNKEERAKKFAELVNKLPRPKVRGILNKV